MTIYSVTAKGYPIFRRGETIETEKHFLFLRNALDVADLVSRCSDNINGEASVVDAFTGEILITLKNGLFTYVSQTIKDYLGDDEDFGIEEDEEWCG